MVVNIVCERGSSGMVYGKGRLRCASISPLYTQFQRILFCILSSTPCLVPSIPIGWYETDSFFLRTLAILVKFATPWFAISRSEYFF